MVHLIFIVTLFFTIPDINKRYPFWFFTFLFLFLFLALRYDYGPDYMEYSRIHFAIQNGLSSWGQNDLLYKYLNLIVSNFYLLIVLLSLVYIFTIYKLIRKNLRVNQYWFSFLILLINPYLFLIHLSSLRQTLAICLVVLSINFAIKRNIIRFFVIILIAIGFHASAVIMLPVYFILNEKKLEKKTIIVIFAGLFVLLFTPIFNIIAYKVLEYLPSHYLLYFEQGLRNSLRATLISSVFFFFIILNINKLNTKNIVYGKLSLISSVIALLAYKVSMITRFGMYFDIFLIISIPQLFETIEKKIYRQLIFALIIFIYILRYYSFFTNPNWSAAYGIYKTILGL